MRNSALTKIALTGASGFVGRHVLSELTKQNIPVIAVTRNAKSLPYDPEVSQICEYDIYTDQEDPFVALGRPDILIHLAWGGLPHYRSLHHFERELPLQYLFLKKMIENGLKTLVVAGTCFEYGMQSGPLSESMVTRPENPYGYAKDALRKQLMFLKTRVNFNLIWARLFYMYGEGQSSSSLFQQLRLAIERQETFFNMSGGEQLRDYLPVEAVARILVDISMSGKDIGILNVSSGRPVAIRTLVEGWLDKFQSKIKLNLGHYPYPDYEPMAFWGTRERLDKFLGLA